MGKPWTLLAVAVLSLAVVEAAIESPEYEVVHTESEFEVRLYSESVWMSAPVTDNINSFRLATKLGFHRLFQYIKGANLNWTYIPMTKPVMTSVLPGAGGPDNSSAAYVVHFYVPAKFQDTPPVPLDELHLQHTSFPSHCVAVRKFSGFARDNNIAREAEKLASSLSRSPWANSTSFGSKHAYSVAQYDAPFRLVQRLNEVWIDISGSNPVGCGGSSEVATH